MHGDVGVWTWLAMAVMMVIMALIWIGLPALIAWGFWAAARPGRTRDTPLELVKERYARGEITREQFDQAKGDLS